MTETSHILNAIVKRIAPIATLVGIVYKAEKQYFSVDAFEKILENVEEGKKKGFTKKKNNYSEFVRQIVEQLAEELKLSFEEALKVYEGTTGAEGEISMA